MAPSSETPVDAVLERLRSDLRGPTVTPGHPDYEELRRIVVSVGTDPRPAIIARAADAHDVALVVSLAREHGLELAVRSGGHSSVGHSTIDGGLVLDLRDLDSLDIDTAGRTAWAGVGVTAGGFTTAAGAHGLAVGFGDTGSVGLGGVTLGGGIGLLARKHGLTIDSLLAAELVTADGRIRHVDAETEPDLFWAIRGGGGNVGVATRLRFRLHPVPSIVGGLLVLPATADTVAGFIAASEAAPDELSTIATVMPCPPVPFVGEAHHGTLVILANLVWAADTPTGEAVLAPFRALAEPLADLVREMPYASILPPEERGYPPAVTRTLFMDRLGLPEAATIMEHLHASDASLRVAQIRVLGGAIASVPADATAYAHRSSRIVVYLAAITENPSERPRREAWIDAFAAALRQEDTGAYVNFLGDEWPARIRDAYPGATWHRMVDIKRRYDPDNLFRRNKNVPPA